MQLAAVARAVGLSSVQLTRRFRRQRGLTPTRYLAGLRLDAALSLLRDSPLANAAIAARCGYRTAARLCREIRRRTGHPPGWHRGRR